MAQQNCTHRKKNGLWILMSVNTTLYHSQNKKNPIVEDNTLHGESLKCINVANHLGIELSNDMKWGKYFQGIVSKAIKQMPSFGDI